MNKKTIRSITSKINNICKSIFIKNNIFGFIKAKNVSIHIRIQNIDSTVTNLKFLRFFNIQKQHLIYIKII